MTGARTRAVLLAGLGALAACKSTPFGKGGGLVIQLQPPEAVWYPSAPGTTPWPPVISGGALTDPGLLLAQNDDDSDGDNADDFRDGTLDDTTANGGADSKQLAVLTVMKLAGAPAPGDKLLVRKKSGSGNVRVFRGTTAVLATGGAPMASVEATALMSAAKAANAPLKVEGVDLGDVELCVQWANASGGTVAEACARLQISPSYKAGFGPQIYGDTDRDGGLGVAGAASDRKGHTEWTATRGAIAFVNKDADCSAGTDDSKDDSIGCAPDEADITPFVVEKDSVGVGSSAAGWKVVLRTRVSDPELLNIFNGRYSGAAAIDSDEVTLSSVKWREQDLAKVPATSVTANRYRLGLEATEFHTGQTFDVFVCVTHPDGPVDAACDKMAMQTTPLMLPSNVEPVERVVVARDCNACPAPSMPPCHCTPYPTCDGACGKDNARLMNALATLPAGVSLDVVERSVHDDDLWTQDALEIGGVRSPSASANVVLDLPRPKNLEDWPKTLHAANVAYLNLKEGFDEVQEHWGGNIESGPVGGGAEGHIIRGEKIRMDIVGNVLREESPLFNKLKEFTGKPELELRTRWLAVRHVDEAVALYPSGTSFKFAVADTSRGAAILDGAPESAALFWFCRPTGALLPTPIRNRNADCYGEGEVASSTAKTLTSSGFKFDKLPDGITPRPPTRALQWIRIYKGPGAGQVAHLVPGTASSSSVEIDHVWKLTNPEWIRCAAAKEHGVPCDVTAPTPGTVSDVLRDTWFVAPSTGSRFVVVEDTLDRDPEASWVGKGLGLPRAVPALHTAGELRVRTGANAEFWRKQRNMGIALDNFAGQLAALPGVGQGRIARVPALYVAYNRPTGESWFAEGLVPNIVNFQVVQGAGTAKIFAARPFGPTQGGSDPFETETAAGLGIAPVFVDDWEAYHLNFGEVHCGTNLFHPSRKWP